MTAASAVPLVSAVIPAYNAEAFLADAVGSVLAQTYPNVECVVIDDGSSDDTAHVARDCGEEVVVISQPNRGVSAARNRGAEGAHGSLLSFLDADDVWLPERTERMLEALDAEPTWDSALSATQVVDAELRPLSIHRQDPQLELRSILLCEASLVSTSSNLLIRREAFERAGGFDERLSTAADWALLLKLVESQRLGYVDEPLTLYRRHGGNMSRSVSLMEHDMRLVYDEMFEEGGGRPELRGLRRRAYARLHRVLAGSYYGQAGWGGFSRNAARSLTSHPGELGYFLALPLRGLRRRRGANTTR